MYLFDAAPKTPARLLGTNANSMFGLVHFLESWTKTPTNNTDYVLNAYRALQKRITNLPSGRLNLHPIASDDGSNLAPARLIYQYITLSMLEQFADVHQRISDRISAEFSKIEQDHSASFTNTHLNASNFEFGFQFKSKDQADLFSQALYQSGIYHARCNETFGDRNLDPSKTLQETFFCFQLNLAFRGQLLDQFWQRLHLAFDHFLDPKAEYDSSEILMPLPKESNEQLDFHRALIRAKITSIVPPEFQPLAFLRSRLSDYPAELKPILLDSETYPQYRTQILQLQSEVYEPARRSPPQEFDMLFADPAPKPLAALMLKGETIVGMAFAGPLKKFTQERGVSTDPYLDDPRVYYSMDLTIAKEFRGGMGRLLKQALVLLAIQNGVKAIHGRNRDRMAAGMWAINLSLGSFELQRLTDDYPDQNRYRDCIYYRCPLEWNSAPPALLENLELQQMINGKSLD